jgi:hypothetical protein
MTSHCTRPGMSINTEYRLDIPQPHSERGVAVGTNCHRSHTCMVIDRPGLGQAEYRSVR